MRNRAERKEEDRMSKETLWKLCSVTKYAVCGLYNIYAIASLNLHHRTQEYN